MTYGYDELDHLVSVASPKGTPKPTSRCSHDSVTTRRLAEAIENSPPVLYTNFRESEHAARPRESYARRSSAESGSACLPMFVAQLQAPGGGEHKSRARKAPNFSQTT